MTRADHPRFTASQCPATRWFCRSSRSPSFLAQRSTFALDALFSLFCMCSNLKFRVFMRPRALCKKHRGGGYLHKNAIWNQYVAHSLGTKCIQRAKTQQSIQPDRVGQQALHYRNFAALCFDNDANSFCRKFLIVISMQNVPGVYLPDLFRQLARGAPVAQALCLCSSAARESPNSPEHSCSTVARYELGSLLTEENSGGNGRKSPSGRENRPEHD